MSKVVRASGLVRDIDFEPSGRLTQYLSALDRAGIAYKILDRFDRADGSVVVRIVSQYNHNDLIEL